MKINWKKAYGLLILLFILTTRFDLMLAWWEWVVIWFCITLISYKELEE